MSIGCQFAEILLTFVIDAWFELDSLHFKGSVSSLSLLSILAPLSYKLRVSFIAVGDIGTMFTVSLTVFVTRQQMKSYSLYTVLYIIVCNFSIHQTNWKASHLRVNHRSSTISDRTIQMVSAFNDDIISGSFE